MSKFRILTAAAVVLASTALSATAVFAAAQTNQAPPNDASKTVIHVADTANNPAIDLGKMYIDKACTLGADKTASAVDKMKTSDPASLHGSGFMDVAMTVTNSADDWGAVAHQVKMLDEVAGGTRLIDKGKASHIDTAFFDPAPRTEGLDHVSAVG